MQDFLIVVDMQNDFIDGTLGTKEAVSIVPKVVDKIRYFNGTVLFTRDTHEENYLETQEGHNLPVKHCIRNTKGWQICDALQPAFSECAAAFDKVTFGSSALARYLSEVNERSPIAHVTLVGLCTDICVISNAMLIKAFLPETEIIVDSGCCAGVTPESHENALSAMKMCQITII